MSKKNKKNKTWGMMNLLPHVAPPPVRPPVPQFLRLLITPPREWPVEKQRLFGMIEQSLMLKEQFKNLTVLPPGCITVVG